MLLGSVSNNDTATATKRSLKKWVNAASNFIALIPSRLLNSSNIGKCFWSWILKGCMKVQEKKKKVVVLCSCPRQNVNLVQRRQRNVQKKLDARAKLLFCQSEPIAFCRSHCRHRRRCLSSIRDLTIHHPTSFQTISRLSQVIRYLKEGNLCWSWREEPHPSSDRDDTIYCLAVPVLKKAYNLVISRHSRAGTAKKCTKKRDHVQSCCFSNLLLFGVSVAVAVVVGTLSKDDDDGSENVGKKMNLRSFKLNRVYLDPLNMSNTGDVPWG